MFGLRVPILGTINDVMSRNLLKYRRSETTKMDYFCIRRYLLSVSCAIPLHIRMVSLNDQISQ